MKRSRFGIGLLAALLMLSLLADRAAVRYHGSVAQNLETASHSALAGDWNRTVQLSRAAMACWERCRPFRSAIGNQASMEQVDSLFARLDICLQRETCSDTAGLCAEIAQQVRDLSPSGNWWDIV